MTEQPRDIRGLRMTLPDPYRVVCVRTGFIEGRTVWQIEAWTEGQEPQVLTVSDEALRAALILISALEKAPPIHEAPHWKVVEKDA